MKFYVKQNKYYCGIDLHARNLYACIIEQKGEIVKHIFSLFMLLRLPAS
jgi:hypothetical protein